MSAPTTIKEPHLKKEGRIPTQQNIAAKKIKIFPVSHEKRKTSLQQLPVISFAHTSRDFSAQVDQSNHDDHRKSQLRKLLGKQKKPHQRRQVTGKREKVIGLHHVHIDIN